jgi:hypothetical protein
MKSLNKCLLGFFLLMLNSHSSLAARLIEKVCYHERAKEIVRAYGLDWQPQMLEVITLSPPPNDMAELADAMGDTYNKHLTSVHFSMLTSRLENIQEILLDAEGVPPSWPRTLLKSGTLQLCEAALMGKGTPSLTDLGFKDRVESSEALEASVRVMRMFVLWNSLSDKERRDVGSTASLIASGKRRVYGRWAFRSLYIYRFLNGDAALRAANRIFLERWNSKDVRGSVASLTDTIETVISRRSH